MLSPAEARCSRVEWYPRKGFPYLKRRGEGKWRGICKSETGKMRERGPVIEI